MRKIKKPKMLEYVLLTRWGDKDPHDPWAIGLLSEIGEDHRGMFYRVKPYERYFRHCFRITTEEGREWIEHQKFIEGNK